MTARLPRKLHAGAWWLWALGLGAAASRTTNPLLLGMIVAVAALVVVLRRPESENNGFRFYLVLALAAITIRIAFRAVLGGGFGTHVLIRLPEVSLPSWTSGMALGGPVTVESLLAGAYDGMRLATIVVCVGAANTLADPRRLLRSLPRALYDVGTAAALALSLAPQLIESVARVSRARQLRGQPTRWWNVRSLLGPVLEDAMHRSLATASAMESRGYGRTEIGASVRSGATALAVVGLALLTVGMVGLIGGWYPVWLAATGLVTGTVVGAAGFSMTGSNVGRSVYRPAPWRKEEWLVGASGALSALTIWTVGWLTPAAVTPPVEPLVWPTAPLVATIGIVAAAGAAVISPRPYFPFLDKAPEAVPEKVLS